MALGGGPCVRADYVLIGRDGAARPEPAHAAWLYAQMVRWKQTALSRDLLAAAKACFRPDLYDAALGGVARQWCRGNHRQRARVHRSTIRCDDIAGYVRALSVSDR